MTVQVMVDDLIRRGMTENDIHRVQTAFQNLGPSIQKWPTPMSIIEALPKRVTPGSRRAGLSGPAGCYVGKIMPRLGDAISHKRKRNSVMLPGEGLGDYLKSYNQSGLTRVEFDEQRLNYSSADNFDQEAADERVAIQSEDIFL